MVRIGAHVARAGPLAAATARGAEVVQFFLGDPQGYKAPVLPGDPEEFRRAAQAAGLDVYVHAPYLVNVATTNNKIRIPTRKLLSQHAAAAASIGAKGLIVHGGYVPSSADPAEGFANWRKVFERTEFPLPLLIENTAGGDNAMARTLDAVARLWDAIDAAGAGGKAGFCLDTCHAYAAGEELQAIVDRVMAITGRIDLVHCNNSKDEFGSGRDRHDNLERGTIDPKLLADVVRAAGAPVVCETPDDDGGQAADIAWLRDHLARG
ncbi:MAG TPA: deoxyribonuclease IV [Streptosporangiaceae bacterium]|nr:deoxyribonuclease IV [Streptosporangiaceae bacterium]